MIGAVVFLLALGGIVYIVLRKKSPETADKVVAAVLAAVAAAGAWFGGLFEKLVN